MNRSKTHSSLNQKAILKSWKKLGTLTSHKHYKGFLVGVSLLSQNTPTQVHPLELKGQPFDRHLLSLSPLYQRSRSLFLEGQGTFYSSFVSTPRTLSSAALLGQEIEYSPLERELVWAVHNPTQSRNREAVLNLRTSITSLFHEQNHRILWKFLPSPPHSKSGMRRYLNFVESLVIALDMALADGIGEDFASLFYHIGVIYDPGTRVKKELKKNRLYRNYLQAVLYATYLNLELYEYKDIEKAIQVLYPLPEGFISRVVHRATRLDREFVLKTNPQWQSRHLKQAMQTLCGKTENILEPSENPLDNRLQYLWTEKWLDLMNV